MSSRAKNLDEDVKLLPRSALAGLPRSFWGGGVGE